MATLLAVNTSCSSQICREDGRRGRAQCDEPPVCGDGRINENEQCDDGAENGDTAACTSSCMLNICGDGLRWSGHEDCDEGGATATCEADCRFPVCGDKIINHLAGEQCDGYPGPEGGCNDECRNVQALRIIPSNGSKTEYLAGIHPLDGDIIIYGGFNGSLFGDTAAAKGRHDGFVARLSLEGDILWLRTLGGADAIVSPSALAVSDEGDICMSSSYNKSIVFAEGTTAERTFSSSSRCPIVTCWNASGEPLRATSVSCDHDGLGFLDVSFLPDGSLVAAGHLHATATLDLASGPLTISTKSTTAAIVSFDKSGEVQWAITLDVEGDGPLDGNAAHVADVVVRPNGEILLTGTYHGTVSAMTSTGRTVLADSGLPDSYIATAAADGRWTSLRPIEARIWSTVQENERLYIGGSLYPGQKLGTVQASSAGLLLARFSPDLTVDWTRTAGASGNDIVFDLAVFPNGDVAAAGRFGGAESLVLGKGESGETTIPLLGGETDAFVARYTPNGRLRWAVPFQSEGTDTISAVATDGPLTTIASGTFSNELIVGAGNNEHRVTPTGPSDFYIAVIREDD